MIVCHCNGVTDRAIRKAVREGAGSPREVRSSCAAGAACGGCGPVIDEIIESERRRATVLMTSPSFARAS